MSADAVIGLRGGAITIHFSTAPERLQEGLAALDTALDRFVNEGPTAAEVDRARQYLRGARRVTGQTAMSRCQEIVLDVVYGLGLGRSESLDTALSGVDREKIRRLAEQLFVKDGVHTILLGPRPKEEPESPSVSQLHGPT